MTYIDMLKNNETAKEELVSEFIGQLVDQLDVLDPSTDDGDEIVSFLETALENREVHNLLCFLLGVNDIEQWLEDTIVSLND